jgi:hypothetical protein
MTQSDDATPKKPGRKAETPAQRLARAERDLIEAKRAVKEAESRRHATIGAALMEEAQGDAEFRAKLREILRRRVTSKAAIADIAVALTD